MHEPSPTSNRYTWPKYVWGVFVLGVIISVFAVIKESRRVKRMQASDPLWAAPATATNAAPGR